MLDKKYQDLLELAAILQKLSEYCVSERAKEAALQLTPSTSKETVRRGIMETSAALNMLNSRGTPPFSRLFDVRFPVQRASMGGTLNTLELLHVASVLRSARVLKSYFEEEEQQESCIDYLFQSLIGNRYLENRISDSILGEDEIADSASAELASIRRKIRQETSNVRATLQKIISSPSFAKYLQEQIVTTRSGRFVVPVKVEHKNDIPGLIHDVSSTGMTVFVEPASVVKANNELKELTSRESKEIERILAELSAECAEYENQILTDFGIIIQLDFIFAKAKLSAAMNAVASEDEGCGIFLRRARHPLLDPARTVPVDIVLGNDYDTLIITGPNTGGKTVTLKTIGLFALMNQCGLHIPADSGSSLPVFSHIMADIGDEQSIEQSLSTFSSHMKNIVEIIDKCDEESLILFDEIGAGTDPTEGAALAIAIIEAVRKKGAVTAATTHYSELKVYAINNDRIQNASCEFDVSTLSPTYRLLIGIPGKSNAFAIARKLGLSEMIIRDASDRLVSSDVSLEDTIAKLDEMRVELEKEKNVLSEKLLRIEENEKKTARMKAEWQVRLEKSEVLARREADRIIREAKDTVESVFAELDEIRKQKETDDDVSRINAERNLLREKLNKARQVKEKISVTDPENVLISSRSIQVGDIVLIKSMNAKAEVLSVSKEGIMELQAGIMHVSAKSDDVFLLEDEKKKTPPSHSSSATIRNASVSPSIDLRGLDSTEAVFVAEQYLDNALMAKLGTVTIIHGKGTGVLRSAIHQMLKKNRIVKSFRLGIFGEGESGVTIVELK